MNLFRSLLFLTLGFFYSQNFLNAKSIKDSYKDIDATLPVVSLTKEGTGSGAGKILSSENIYIDEYSIKEGRSFYYGSDKNTIRLILELDSAPKGLSVSRKSLHIVANTELSEEDRAHRKVINDEHKALLELKKALDSGLLTKLTIPLEHIPDGGIAQLFDPNAVSVNYVKSEISGPNPIHFAGEVRGYICEFGGMVKGFLESPKYFPRIQVLDLSQQGSEQQQSIQVLVQIQAPEPNANNSNLPYHNPSIGMPMNITEIKTTCFADGKNKKYICSNGINAPMSGKVIDFVSTISSSGISDFSSVMPYIEIPFNKLDGATGIASLVGSKRNDKLTCRNQRYKPYQSPEWY